MGDKVLALEKLARLPLSLTLSPEGEREEDQASSDSIQWRKASIAASLGEEGFQTIQ